MPQAERPSMTPGYGIAASAEGLLEWAWADAQLAASRNYWVATTRNDGRAHVSPVWGVWTDGALWFSTDGKSVKGRNLAARPDVTVHLESGDDVVIIEGRVETPAVPDAVNDAYAAKYGGIKLTGGPEGSPVYRLRPDVALGWLESDYPNTATRWRFA